MTKQELIRTAVSLITAYPQTSSVGSGDTIFTSSAEAYYNIKVPAAMETFIYGFGISAFTLNNPSIDDKDSNYKIFNIPDSVGFIFTICREKDLPLISSLIGVKGLRRTSSIFFSKLKNKQLRIYHPSEYKEPLVVGYISKFPAVSEMTASFRNYIMYDIAQQLALKNIQQRSVQQLLSYQSNVYKRAAQKFSLDNVSLFEYDRVGLTDSPFVQNAYQEDKNVNPATSTYFRGV